MDRGNIPMLTPLSLLTHLGPSINGLPTENYLLLGAIDVMPSAQGVRPPSPALRHLLGLVLYLVSSSPKC